MIATATAIRRGAALRLPAATSLTWPLAMLSVLLVAQFWLIFVKSFNWDEFLHFSMVYALREGTLDRPFQSLLARLLYWAPDVSGNLIVQMLAARTGVWLVFATGLFALYGLARQFVSRADALWTTLLYLTAGNVFSHAFAIRADPIAMAVLMLALYLLASRPLSWATALLVGALMGFAGLLTVKAVFYAPAFAGIGWLRLSQATDRRGASARMAAIIPAAVGAYAGAYLLHRAGLAPPPPAQQGGAFFANGLQWLTDGWLRQPRHITIAAVTAPVLVFALLRVSFVWRDIGLGREKTIALVGLILPLLTILFYRNVFPYFFVFILAPVVVGLAPVVAELRNRYGPLVLAGTLCLVPLVKVAMEPADVLQRQRALIGYVHDQAPPGSRYLDYSGMIADYPRAFDHLVSGIGIANYRKRGVPLVAQAVEAGDLAFVIENGRAGPLAAHLLPADTAALRDNFVHVGGDLWFAGETIPAGTEAAVIEIPASGKYTTNGPLVIDGASYRAGAVLHLNAGRHVVAGPRSGPIILWRGERVPVAAPSTMAGPLFTDF